MCLNIKRNRAAITPEQINEYFDNLTNVVSNIPPNLITKL